MKILRFPSRTRTAAIAAFLSLTAGSHAANLFWDGGAADIAVDGNGASAGGAGTWDTTLLNWDAGAAPHVAWNNAANDTAVFAGAAGAINVAAPVTVGGLTFLLNGFTFTGTPVELASGAIVKGANTTYNLAGLALAAGNTTWRFASSSTATTFANANVFRISEAITGSVSVVISGPQPMYLNAVNSYAGGTTVEAGASLGFDTFDISGLAPGSVVVGANASILRRGGNLNNALLQLLAPTTEVFTIYANNAGSANALDLTAIPNASLATWDNAGTRSFAFTGTITPGSNGYRFGGSKATNYVNLSNANSLTGANALTIVPGSISKLRILNANDFSGDTIVNSGTVFLNSALGLQNSAINTSGAGKIDVSGPRDGLTPTTATPVTTPTLGGLKGSTDINLVFNATYTTAGGTGVTSLTLNPGDGVTNSYSGIISDGAVGMTLTKTGVGTQILSGVNSYTGATAVTGGTLLVNNPGSLHASSAVNVSLGGTLGGNGTINGSVTVGAEGSLAPGASAGTLSIGGNLNLTAQAAGTGKLAFELAALAATSDKIAVSGSVNIGPGALGFGDFIFTNTGSMEAGTYKLITSSGLTGTLDAASLSGAIGTLTGTLQINGNDLELVVTGIGGTPYSTWAGGAAFNADANGDGLANGIAWMLGATSPAANAHAILPAPQTTSSFLTLYLQRASSRGTAKLFLNYGTSLSSWTPVEIPAASATVGGDIVVIVTPGSPTEDVTVKIPASHASPSGRLFVRLQATEN